MILVTGGSGFIGSSVVDLLLTQTSEKIIILDRRINSWTYDLVAKNRDRITAILCDIMNDCDRETWIKYLDSSNEKLSTIVHLAGLISVPESVQHPMKYYNANVNGMLYIVELAKKYDSNIVFSSSAGVYAPASFTVYEDSHKGPKHPYGQTKLWCEEILEAADNAYGIKSAVLRYFNAAGAGDNHGYYEESASHAIPALMRAIKHNRNFYINGNDYDRFNTPDGTCVRDYLHVKDIARAHINSLEYLKNGKSITVNLGTGVGTSMLQLVDVASKVLNKNIRYEFRGRRIGDPAYLVADVRLANTFLKWKPKFDLEDIIGDAWEWEKRNEL